METRYLICTNIYIFYTKDIIFLIQHIKQLNMSTSKLINCMAAGQKYVASGTNFCMVAHALPYRI